MRKTIPPHLERVASLADFQKLIEFIKTTMPNFSDHDARLLKLFWGTFKKNDLTLLKNEWLVFSDVFLDYYIKKNGVDFKLRNTNDEAFLLLCADIYAMLFQKNLHMYSKKLSVIFLFSATIATIQNNITIEKNLRAIKDFLLNLMNLHITEALLNKLTPHLIHHYASENQSILATYYEQLKTYSTSGHNLNALLSSESDLRESALFSNAFIDDYFYSPKNPPSLDQPPTISREKEEAITPPIRPNTEAHTSIATHLSNTHLVFLAENIKRAMTLAIDATSESQKKYALDSVKVALATDLTLSEESIKKFLHDFASIAAKPKTTHFGEAEFGNTNSMRTFFLNLSQETQSLLKKALPNYDISYHPGLFGRHGKLSILEKEKTMRNEKLLK